MPVLTNRQLLAFARQLHIDDFEFYRTHWAVKDCDLVRVLLRNARPQRPQPQVFRLSEHGDIEPDLMSVMMPFDAAFAPVHEAIQAAAAARGFRCQRADNIWENPAIIQDVVSLIDRSCVVVCDCTGRNANVFYETGIAHTLGREVILITQAAGDIPFDIQHLRHVRYLNNDQGREELQLAWSDGLLILP